MSVSKIFPLRIMSGKDLTTQQHYKGYLGKGFSSVIEVLTAKHGFLDKDFEH